MWMARSPYAPVYGFVLDELIDAGGWRSLATFSDGTTSLYTSEQDGVLGAGTHEGVRMASASLLSVVRDHLGDFAPTVDTALPAPGRVALRALTTSGQLVTGDAPEVYAAAQRLIYEVRAATPT
jgi:hypothetical protein